VLVFQVSDMVYRLADSDTYRSDWRAPACTGSGIFMPVSMFRIRRPHHTRSYRTRRRLHHRPGCLYKPVNVDGGNRRDLAHRGIVRPFSHRAVHQRAASALSSSEGRLSAATVEMELVQMWPAGAETSALRGIRVPAMPATQNSALLDADELGGLIKALEHVSTLPAKQNSPTFADVLELTFRSRDNLVVSGREELVTVTVDSVPPVSALFTKRALGKVRELASIALASVK
jgi:hypothetical protein